MALKSNVKSEVIERIERYENRINHLYLDTKGKVTVGVGHMIPNIQSIGMIDFYKVKNNIPLYLASQVEKKAEFEKIAQLPYGQRYGADSFKKYTSLIMKDQDINLLRDRHIESFYNELKNIYKKSNGYTNDFDNFHKNIQLALFDMIFNLGATKIVNQFPKFNAALKAGDWKKADLESNRPDVNEARNGYVRLLFNTVPAYQNTTTSSGA